MAHTLSWALAAIGIIFAAFVKGVTGLGFPVIGIPVAAQFLDPQTTVVAISIPAFLMNLIQAFQGGISLAMVRRFAPTIVFLIPGAIVGTALLAKVPGAFITGILGFIVTLYAALSIWRLRLVLQPARERQAGAVVGLCGGLVGGATGMFSPPLVMYLTALRLRKETFVAAVSLCFIAGQIPQFLSLVGFQLITVPRLGMALLFCLLSAVGFLVGLRLQRSISQRVFAQGVLVVLLVVGLNLIRSGFMGRQ
jgi:uncharacterized protein